MEIMKKYKTGEMSSVSGMPKKEKPKMEKYSQGEFSKAGGKASKDKLASWSKAKISQGSHN
tara:strand:- start:32 stop:214 length:183 start_codon:yes stop_codon:yes gene_type:complete